MKMEQTECSETLAYIIQTPGKYPEESIHHSKHGKSLKSRTLNIVYSNNPQVKNGTVTCYIVKNIMEPQNSNKLC
jgi:hypothetical protein